MKTQYFTFGFQHVHKFGPHILDRNIVIKVTAKDPEKQVREWFGLEWSMVYDEPPKMEYYPRGILEI